VTSEEPTWLSEFGEEYSAVLESLLAPLERQDPNTFSKHS